MQIGSGAGEAPLASCVSLSNAWFFTPAYPTNDFFNRCLPLPNASSITVGSPLVAMQDFNTVASSASLKFQFESGEVVNGKYLIIACVALSTGFAILHSFLLSFISGPVVWAALILAFARLLAISSLLLFKNGILNSAFLPLASFELVFRKTMNISVLSSVSAVIKYIQKRLIALGTALFSLFIFNGWMDLLKNTKQFQPLPCLLVIFLAYLIASFFLSVFESCIHTFFECFYEDSARSSGIFTGQTPPSHQPRSSLSITQLITF